MHLLPEHRIILENELNEWHRIYLPLKPGTVLDVGAGCGETARFYLLHGAHKVIAIEGSSVAFSLLKANFYGDRRVVPVFGQIGSIKIDIEGSEDGLTVEWHGQRTEETLRCVAGGFRVSRFRISSPWPRFGTGFPFWHMRHARTALLDHVRGK